jgi:phage terminase large subunit
MCEWQKELVERVADVERKILGIPTRYNHEGKNKITVRACQGPGKTFGIAELAHIWGFAYDPIVIPVIAPKKDHVKTRFFAEFSRIAARAVPGYKELLGMRIGAETVTWGDDPVNHLLLAETGVQPENVQGLRRATTLSLVDESSGVHERLWPVIEGNMAGSELAILVMIGNPTRNSGTFAESHLKAKLAQDYDRMHVGPEKSKRIKRSWIDGMVRKYGDNSPVVKVRCYGEFASEDANQLISLAWINDAFLREFTADGSLPRLRVTVDAADGGIDETVVTVGRHFDSHTRVLKQKSFSFSQAKAQIEGADAAEQMFLAYGGRKDLDDFVVDSLGVGTGMAGELYDRGYRVIRYKGGESADNEKWKNRRTQSYLVARDAFRDGLISFEPDSVDDIEELEAQLCSVKRKIVGDDRIEELVTREEMRREGLQSPDRADSLVMQFATQAPVFSPASHGKEPDVVYGQSTVLDGLV